jgi:hypothetical protein
MRDKWYSDNRDLVKWGILLRLTETFQTRRILQLAYYRPSEFAGLIIDGQPCTLPADVVAHFRNVQHIAAMTTGVRITVFDAAFQDREAYLRAVLALLPAFACEQTLVFLDPDTGLQPQGNATFDHVLESEVREIWDAMKAGDVLALYQHQTNRNGQPWIEVKRQQFAETLYVETGDVKIAYGPEIAQDVVFYYIAKP